MNSPRLIPALLAPASLAAAGAALLLDAPYAFAPALAALCVFFAALIALFTSNVLKNVALSLFITAFCLFGAELFFSITEAGHEALEAGRRAGPRPAPPSEAERFAVMDADGFTTWSEFVLRNDPAVGYRPKKGGARIAARKECGGERVYDVVYSTLPSGWRATPQHPEADEAVLLFGCSFTWGEGLNDRDTIAWQLADRLGDKVQVFNFGFPGYGSHHMLAHLENGLLADIAGRYKTIKAFYITIRGHELRSMGYSQWDASGPWYGFEKGRLTRKGVFADDVSPLRPYADALFGKSSLYRKYLRTKFIPRSLRFRQHAGIIAEAAGRLEACCHAPLTAVLWPRAAFAKELEAEGVPVLDLAPLFPGYENDAAQYALHECDGHPNARAASIAADALARFIAGHPL